MVVLLLAAIVGISVLVNYGPVSAYRSAHSRLDAATAQVSELKQQKEQLQSELGKLGEAGYLESLAREELTYAKPGEEIYIVPTEEGASAPDESKASDEPAEKPGFLERVLSAIGDIF